MTAFLTFVWHAFWFVLAVALGYKLWCATDAIHELNRTVQLLAQDIRDLRTTQPIQPIQTMGGVDTEPPQQ